MCIHTYVPRFLAVVSVTFEPVSCDAKEGDTVNLTLKISTLLETSVTVTVETIPVTAGENDYMMVLVSTGSDPAHSYLPTLTTLPVECTMSPNAMVATQRVSQ